MTTERLRRYQLTIELATLIATSDDPALALRQHQDDLVDELVAGRRNLASSGPLVEAFREAIGYSRKVPDALGERDVEQTARGRAPGLQPASPVPSRSPNARERVGWRLVDGGHA